MLGKFNLPTSSQYISVSSVYREVHIISKNTIIFVTSVCMSVWLHTWNNSAPAGYIFIKYDIWVKVKCSLYRSGVAQRVGRGIALLFHDCGTRRGWVVRSTPRPHLTPGKDPVPIWQEAGWAPEPDWTGEKSLTHRDSIPDRPARSQSLYRLRYTAHAIFGYIPKIWGEYSSIANI